MASTNTSLYADTSGKLFAETAANRIEVIFTYTTSGANASLTGFTPKTYAGPLEIPRTLGGYTVTSIGAGAFRDCTRLTSVTFASGSQLLSIGNYAFYVSGRLTSINIPASVTSIGDKAFYGCHGLTSIDIPALVTSIGDQAFSVCNSLTSIFVHLSNQTYSSSDGVLYNDNYTTLIQHPIGKSVSTFIIPGSVISISTFAFSYSASLTAITIPASVITIGDEAFTHCKKLTSISVDSFNQNYLSFDGVLYDKLIHTLIHYPIGKSGSTFTIPVSVTSIGKSAFYDCINLTSIEIPNSITSIGDQAFRQCINLGSIIFASGSQLQTIGNFAFLESGAMSIIIPASVTSIGVQAFYYCRKLPSISVDSSNQNYSSVDGILYDKLIHTLIQCPAGKSGSTFIIPESVTSIAANAFFGCARLTAITIPTSVTSISNDAFQISGLIAVNVSVDFLTSKSLTAGSNKTFYGKSGVTIVGYKLFKSTGELTWATSQLNGATLAIIEGYSSIGANAFLNATSLTSIEIPDSVTSIGENAFKDCSNLTSISLDLTNQNYSSFEGILYNKAANTLICYPPGKSGSRVKIPNTVRTIYERAFAGCLGLSSIIIPASVTSIGINAFQDSGLITMYVSRINGLGLTRGISVTRYGKTFTVKDVAPATIPICFQAGAKVTTDQGDIALEKLNPKIHTISGKKIVSIAKTTPLQNLFYNGKVVKAMDLVEGYQGVTEKPYNSEILYLVRMKK